jgi:hypothetical protein
MLDRRLQARLLGTLLVLTPLGLGACSDTVSVETSDPVPSAPVLSVNGDLVDYAVMKQGMGRLARRVAFGLAGRGATPTSVRCPAGVGDP